MSTVPASRTVPIEHALLDLPRAEYEEVHRRFYESHPPEHVISRIRREVEYGSAYIVTYDDISGV